MPDSEHHKQPLPSEADRRLGLGEGKAGVEQGAADAVGAFLDRRIGQPTSVVTPNPRPLTSTSMSHGRASMPTSAMLCRRANMGRILMMNLLESKVQRWADGTRRSSGR